MHTWHTASLGSRASGNRCRLLSTRIELRGLLSNDPRCAAHHEFVLRVMHVSVLLWPTHPVAPQCPLAQAGQPKEAGPPCRGQLAFVSTREFGQSSKSEQTNLVRGQRAPWPPTRPDLRSLTSLLFLVGVSPCVTQRAITARPKSRCWSSS